MRIPVVCTVLAFGLLACHTSTAYLNGDELAGAPKVSAETTPCNDVEQQGKEVDLEGSHEAAPLPTGGTIVDGTYVLTSSVLHTSDRSHGSKLVGMGRITMRVNGSTSQLVRNGADGRERRTTVNRVSSGNTTTLHTTCASPAKGKESTSVTNYTATANTLQFITPGPAGTVVATYTRL